MSFKEQQLKKIKAKQKRLQAILGGTEILDKVNEIEFEEDEGMGEGWKLCSTLMQCLFMFEASLQDLCQ